MSSALPDSSLYMDEGGMKEQTGLKTHPGWDDGFTERDTNEFSHNRDGNILYRHTEGCWDSAHLEVCRLKNRQCGIKQRLRNGCTEEKKQKKKYYTVVSTNQQHIEHQD